MDTVDPTLTSTTMKGFPLSQLAFPAHHRAHLRMTSRSLVAADTLTNVTA